MPSFFDAAWSVPGGRRNRRVSRGRWRIGLPLIAALFVGGGVGAVRGISEFREANSTLDVVSDAVSRLRQENDSLRETARRLREDPTVIEDVAREDLGLIRPGEKVFVFVPPPPGRQ